MLLYRCLQVVPTTEDRKPSQWVKADKTESW